jgi:hypothetical protein
VSHAKNRYAVDVGVAMLVLENDRQRHVTRGETLDKHFSKSPPTPPRRVRCRSFLTSMRSPRRQEPRHSDDE